MARLYWKVRGGDGALCPHRHTTLRGVQGCLTAMLKRRERSVGQLFLLPSKPEIVHYTDGVESPVIDLLRQGVGAMPGSPHGAASGELKGA